MKDRVSGAPGQYSAVVTGADFQKMQSGEPFSITLVRNDKPEVIGTPYSKVAVLPDEVANKICPDLEDPSPADAFNAVANQVFSVGEENNGKFLRVVDGKAKWVTIVTAEGGDY